MTPNNQSDEDSESEFQIQLNINDTSWSKSSIYTLCVPLGPNVDATVKIKIQILMKIHFDNRKFWLSKIIFWIPFWLEIPNTT